MRQTPFESRYIPCAKRKGTLLRSFSFYAGSGIRTHVGCPKLFSRPPRYDHFDIPAYFVLDLTLTLYYTRPPLSRAFLKNIADGLSAISVFRLLVPQSSLVHICRESEFAPLQYEENVQFRSHKLKEVYPASHLSEQTRESPPHQTL